MPDLLLELPGHALARLNALLESEIAPVGQAGLRNEARA
jgi:hypothetical protein